MDGSSATGGAQSLLIVVIDTTASSQAAFPILKQMYLAPLTKLFTEQSRLPAEFAVVAYRNYPPWSDYTTMASPITGSYQTFWGQWISSLQFGGGGSSAHAIADALCVAHQKSKESNAKNKYMVLVTCASLSEIGCRSCAESGDAYAHASKLAQDNINFCIISNHTTEPLKMLFQRAYPQAGSEALADFAAPPSQERAQDDHMVYLRNLAIPHISAAVVAAAAAAAAAAAPVSSVPGASSATLIPTGVPSAVPAGGVPPAASKATAKAPPKRIQLWEGNLAWAAHHYSPTKRSLDPAYKTDPNLLFSRFVAVGIVTPETVNSHEWPQQMTVTSVCLLHDPAFNKLLKGTASTTLEFYPSPSRPTAKQEFLILARKLSEERLAAMIEITNIHLVALFPNKDRLYGIILSKSNPYPHMASTFPGTTTNTGGSMTAPAPAPAQPKYTSPYATTTATIAPNAPPPSSSSYSNPNYAPAPGQTTTTTTSANLSGASRTAFQSMGRGHPTGPPR